MEEGKLDVAIFVTGGARSGKSHFAEQLAQKKYSSGIYIATSEALDEEMTARITKHQADRKHSGFPWETLEVPLKLADCLRELRSLGDSKMQQRVVLVDCLTLWLSNCFFALDVELNGTDRLHEMTRELAEEIARYPYPLIIVSNEVGDGIVPVDALSRQYRDEAGRLNQLIAKQCEQVFLVTAGIPVDLKKLEFRWEEL